MHDYHTMDQLEIGYEDDAVLAVLKPAWLLVHRGMANDDITLVDIVRDYTGETAYPMHRLDRQTSGVMLFAKSKKIAGLLRLQFENKTIEKKYLACVRGIAPESGVIDNTVPKSEGGDRVDALTIYRRRASVEIEPREVSLVECEPKTGRFHQIRRHLKHINHPILMDANYGKTKLNREFKTRWGLSRLALHASQIKFVHPTTEEVIVVDAPIPSDLEEPFIAMGLL